MELTKSAQNTVKVVELTKSAQNTVKVVELTKSAQNTVFEVVDDSKHCFEVVDRADVVSKGCR
ncbi:Uncharacterised protein [Streptococcus pneumoniae]|nr:Uncharacterised protein [Streptococcus pneumoniae]